MNRPWITWTVLAVCALLILGAMGWLTHRVLGMESESSSLQAEGELEERVRLALSRMDTAASSILLVENQRPPSHYEAFFRPLDVFTNQFRNVAPDIVLQPSPLLGELPEFVRLNFALGVDGALTSPQVPTGNQRDMVETSGVDPAMLATAAEGLDRLGALLESPALPESTGGAATTMTNKERFYLACAPATATWNAVRVEEVEEKAAAVQEQRSDTQISRTTKGYQQDFAYVEKGKRSQVLEQALSKAAQSSIKQAVTAESKVAAATKLDAPPQPEMAALAPADASAVPAAAEMTTPQLVPEAPSTVTPFQPVWLGDELFAIREVHNGAGVLYQGLWLQAGELARHLLSTVDDLLPAASVEPVQALVTESIPAVFDLSLEELQADPRTLVTVPWRLLPGETPSVPLPGWTPLRVSLITGWVAVALALLAAAALVRGVMKLSERRASFVSSVTHELRTPLTTFQLYSDMLAEGMVKDESKRDEYLGILRHESGRLNHLIENVLAYSRIERGSARARHERTGVADLLERFRPQLEERAGKEGALVEIGCDGSCDGVEVDTDTTAIGQIVFNLVDNACKYGMPETGGGTVRLNASVRGRKAVVEVCDNGCGIAARDLKNVFRPFHKSAKDAAQSKPGVGLGLALSRRLARALGGELKVDGKRDSGACFVLELPVKTG